VAMADAPTTPTLLTTPSQMRTNPKMSINPSLGDSQLSQLRDKLLAIQPTFGLPQLTALITIGIQPGISVNDLAMILDIPQQTASRIVSSLAGRYQQYNADPHECYVLQKINESDPRRRALYLTDAGRSIIENFRSK